MRIDDQNYQEILRILGVERGQKLTEEHLNQILLVNQSIGGSELNGQFSMPD